MWWIRSTLWRAYSKIITLWLRKKKANYHLRKSLKLAIYTGCIESFQIISLKYSTAQATSKRKSSITAQRKIRTLSISTIILQLTKYILPTTLVLLTAKIRQKKFTGLFGMRQRSWSQRSTTRLEKYSQILSSCVTSWQLGMA